MDIGGLKEGEWKMILAVLQRHREIRRAILYGSRAKGTAVASSDIDLALEGIDDPFQAEAVARELEELPLPYRFDVAALTAIKHQPLRDHIERVGVAVYIN